MAPGEFSLQEIAVHPRRLHRECRRDRLAGPYRARLAQATHRSPEGNRHEERQGLGLCALERQDSATSDEEVDEEASGDRAQYQ